MIIENREKKKLFDDKYINIEWLRRISTGAPFPYLSRTQKQNERSIQWKNKRKRIAHIIRSSHQKFKREDSATVVNHEERQFPRDA